jgi:N-methylhydantoinase A
MARAIKAISVERGVDPAGVVLLPFGGAGAMHACAVARELNMTRLVVPPSPGLLCAYGALVADVVHERVLSLLRPLPAQFDARELVRQFAAVAVEGQVERAVTLRYQGQSFELAVPADGDLVAAFHAAHRARYGYSLPRTVELCTLRVRGVERTPAVPPPRAPLVDGAAQVGRATSRWDGRAHDTAILARERLRDGARVDGPALIVEYSATTYLPPGARAESQDGALHIELR